MVRAEIAAAHEQTAQWERSLDQPPTTVAHWTKLAEFAGPNLKKAMRAGIVHIEIPADAASGSSLGKPRFVIEGEPVSSPGKER
ncbi:MAG: hypothetical protein M5U09_25110 [Gammaproteobacteria bacterium]|nr:hypothetical protein [Gammaproteobacteria bacterium]